MNIKRKQQKMIECFVCNDYLKQQTDLTTEQLYSNKLSIKFEIH